ncbi:MAG TPA: HIT family protein [Solirubrobacteraceae bacterium]
MSDPDCIFCKIVAGELPAQIIEQDERTVTFMDIAPATRGHALVIPRAHAADLLSVAGEDLDAVTRGAQRLAARMGETLGADGVNLLNSCGAAAWQTVFHFHVHVIPRYSGDPLRLPWVPSAGDPDQIAAVAQELSVR